MHPLQLADITLQNRIIMAPLARMRSKQPLDVPYELNAAYYAQRASADLIISEATQISKQGQRYPSTPGIYSLEQITGWKLVTEVVHKKGGKIFLQLWHVGRISHSSHQPDGALPVAPSAIKLAGKVLTTDWKQVDYDTPHALRSEEIQDIIQDYKIAAKNAKDADFDGVEIHGANGYLVDQFLQDGSNSTFNDMSDSDLITLFTYVTKQLSNRGIAYIHMIEPPATSAGGSDTIDRDVPCIAKIFKLSFNDVFISAGDYTPETVEQAVENATAKAITFGRFFISNPDLPERIKAGEALNPDDRTTCYGDSEKGYIDYPFMNKR